MANRLRKVSAAARPAWMELPSFSAAVLFWANEWRNKDELEREMDDRNRVARRARIRSYWENCDERHTHPEPDLVEVHESVMSILREAMRKELIRLGECNAAFRRAVAEIHKPNGKPFLSTMTEMLEAGAVDAPPKLELVKGRGARKVRRKEGAP